MTTYLPREIASSLAEALRTLPVVAVTGLRQTGKTTLLREDPSLANRRYVTLDDFASLEAARQNPDALLRGAEPVTIDEAQRCPDLFLALKRAVDEDRRPGRFLISGSANFALLQGLTESLAGRALYLPLRPFSRRERSGAIDELPFLVRFWNRPEVGPDTTKKALPLANEEVLRGGMPPVALAQVERPDLWFLGYEQTYLERDVRALARVGDLVTFRNFLKLACLRTGQVLNASQLARDAGLSAASAARYLGLLEASFVIRRVPPFLASRTTRLIKSPKLYVSDSGLAGHMIGARDEASRDDPLAGALLETYVAENLSSILDAHLPAAELAFWNVQGRHEVDFVIALGRECLAIEVKAASRFEERHLAGLRAFKRSVPAARACVLAYNGTEAADLGGGLFAVPLGLLLS